MYVCVCTVQHLFGELVVEKKGQPAISVALPYKLVHCTSLHVHTIVEITKPEHTVMLACASNNTLNVEWAEDNSPSPFPETLAAIRCISLFLSVTLSR